MTEHPGGFTDAGSAWRQEAERDFDLGQGRMVRMLRPDAATFMKAGLDPLCFDIRTPERQRRNRIKEEMTAISRDTAREEKFLVDILGMCMLSPKLWTGDPAETPPGHVHRRHLGSDAEILLVYAFQMSGLIDAEGAAKAARAFRPDGDGDAGERDSDAVRGAAEPGAAPEPSGLPPGPGDGAGGAAAPEGGTAADTENNVG